MPIKSIQVKEYMSGKLVTFSPDTDVRDAIHELVRHRIAGAPVVDNHGTLVGMLSEFDCLSVILKAAYHEHPGGPVSELMTTEVGQLPLHYGVKASGFTLLKRRGHRVRQGIP